MLIVDFETRSRCNLITRGSYNYARDSSTDILCAAFAPADPDDDREWLWFPPSPLPDDLLAEIKKADLIAAHNAAFDREIWRYIATSDYGFPEIPFANWYCTSAQARVNNLPASLDDAARALNSKHRKDHHGSLLIRKLSIPQKDGEFLDAPLLLLEMGDYCLQDVRVTKALVNATRRLSLIEHDDWVLNEYINERGVLIDIPLAEAAQLHANDEYIEIAERLSTETNGVVTKHTQTTRAANWILNELSDAHPVVQLMRKTSAATGESTVSLDKAIRERIIHAYDYEELDVPEHIMNVVDALHESSASSVTKFKNMALRADDDTHRVHGAFIYAGASQTLRYASRGLQLHNMPSRDLFKTMDETWAVYDDLLCGHEIPKPVMQTLKKMLRHAIMPAEGKVLIIGDWSAIEARVLPWLADKPDSLKKLDLITSGVDIYEHTAKEIGFEGNRPLGKVTELALGYQGALGAFRTFAKIYGVALKEHEIKRVIKAWRVVNSWAVEFWRELEQAAMKAVRNKETSITAGRIKYVYTEYLMGGSLLCILPDESILTYPQVRIEKRRGYPVLTALASSVKAKADDKEWPRETLYGGRLAGHVTQGTAAALLRELISQVDDCIGHVHDEVILEVAREEAEERRAALEDIMNTSPKWATGLVLNATPEIATRYKK